MPNPVFRGGTARDEIERETRKRHEGSEQSFPPPAVNAPPGYAGGPSPTIRDPLPHVERHARWWKAIIAIGAGVAALYAGVRPVVVWFLTRPSDEEVKALVATCSANATDAGVQALVPVTERLKLLEAEKKRNGQRWDQLDKWNEQKKPPGAPPPRKFGPEAERRGEARYDDGSHSE